MASERSDGFRWDRIAVFDVEQRTPGRSTLAVTGLVEGEEGALLLHLPGMVDRHFAVDPGEARALRDALVARVIDPAPAPPDEREEEG